ncbi:nucleotidyl transferase AbiEii/AbiGii toxin family protein [Dialister micraerophilus]|uniref:nucleotidyl transferase AbiEii/AbiGii toxin family protein n=1 Tax=Dialister micraerophilus TaxID=309120 RepID=UPI0023F2DC62|nr:nucleotidyl transferase AbiEii/AbiGii toxin family protein [Dialister micraerophilus]
MEINILNLRIWQKERINIMKEILPKLGDNYVLKGGTALMFFYNLDRFSEDIDLDAKHSVSKIENLLKPLIKQKNWKYNVTKNTDTVFRIMIDYGAVNNLGKYPLKIEVSGRNKNLLNANVLSINNINNINVYNLKELSKMKVIAFSQRDKIRDFYDIAFLLDKNDKLFTNDQLYEIKTIMEYKDLEVLAMYLDKEFSENCLKKINSEDFVLQTYLKLDKLLITRNKEISNFKEKPKLNLSKPSGKGLER